MLDINSISMLVMVCGLPGTGKSTLAKAVAEKIDVEVRKIVDEAYVQAKSILKKYRKELDAVAQKLLEAESITRDEFEAIFPPPIDKKSGTPQPA